MLELRQARGEQSRDDIVRRNMDVIDLWVDLFINDS